MLHYIKAKSCQEDYFPPSIFYFPEGFPGLFGDVTDKRYFFAGDTSVRCQEAKEKMGES
jgi:hypothetical protein